MNVLSRWLWLCVWAGLALYLALTLWLGFAGLVYPFQLVDGDGVVLWFTRQLAQGHAIYKGLTGFPYASSNYPPVGMVLAAALMPLFGDGYVTGRLLHFASALIVAALIYRIVRTETRAQRWGALAALLFLGTPYIYHWVPQFRVDLIGLAFAFGGIYVLWLGERQKSTGASEQLSVTSSSSEKPVFSTVSASFFDLLTRKRVSDPALRQPASEQSTVTLPWLALATALFLLALDTKHSLIAAPAAAFLAIWQRERRQAVGFALALGGLFGAIYLAIDYATSGGFTFGLIESNATVFLPEQLVTLLWDFATTFPLLLLLALWGWITRVRARRIGVLEWYVVTAFAALALAGRTGAWENYFFEALAVACVFTGFQISDFRFQISNPGVRNSPFAFSNFQSPISNLQAPSSILQLLLPALLLLQLALMWHDPRIAVSMMAQDLPANQQLAALLERTPGIVISEDIGALVTSGKGLAYYTFQYSSLARSGKWDQSWELNGLRDGVFPLVILERGTREDVDHYRRFTREFVSTLDRYYARTQTIGKFQVYAPAPPLRLQSADFGDALALVGWSIQPSNLQSPISNLQLSIVWQAKRAMDRRYIAFVHLESSDGGIVTQDDHEPHRGIYPTTRWAANEMVREAYALNVPGDLAPGKYVLQVGWYGSDTGDRLPVPASADDAVTLTAFEIK